MSLSENITSLRTMLDSAEHEIKSLESGRKASASRARLSLQKIKANCHSLRKEITTHTKSLPTKTRVKKVTVEPEPEPEPEPVEPVVEEAPAKKVRKSRAKKAVVEG
jgi:hypothetical protein